MVGPWGGLVGPMIVIVVKALGLEVGEDITCTLSKPYTIVLRERFWKSQLPLK